ncbi:exonuclease domain-containing protein [Pelagibius sp. Alg239-R121]|uniref:exonuclease domain-containing protein n=1 Tax=Pelagibius sp. Alg239-R121 TaxID=2993448 RepID=UPI0024A6B36A|nr:exonuclease domain-containing protein [Pelagibius sp. Alg239-R121]
MAMPLRRRADKKQSSHTSNLSRSSSAAQPDFAFDQEIPERPPNRRPQRELPQRYYLTHFREMLDFVREKYVHVFSDEHLRFLKDFDDLDLDAQCLFVRLVNRKGHVFEAEKLRYAEIVDLPGALERLRNVGLADNVTQDDFTALLESLSKDMLIKLLAPHLETVGVKRSWPKAKVLAHARATLPFASYATSGAASSFIVQGRRSELGFLLYLYFGRIEQGVTRFALRDLGLVRTHHFKIDYEARFETREEAQACFFYAQQREKLRTVEDATCRYWAVVAPQWPAVLSDKAEDLRDKLLYELGSRLEKTEDVESALSVYALGNSALCNERLIRLHYARGERDIVRDKLEAMMATPASDLEALFAQDFYLRKFKGKRTSALTDRLRAASVIGVDESYRNAPERGAAEYFRRQGYEAFQSENALWRALFGMLFWEEIYCEKAASIHNAFEHLPETLKSGRFYSAFQERIEDKLALLKDPAKSLPFLLGQLSKHYGTPNGIFRWRPTITDWLSPFLQKAPPEAAISVLREMCKDYVSRKDGFPDLMLWKEDDLRFIEIKTAGDQIRRNQLMQLELLGRAGFKVEVNRIEWIVDPNQIYVVVDVETTGGRATRNRITEIGAVKLQNGQIFDKWQSLINPQQAVPANITRLTGITNAMVAGAPTFAEIADEFEEFMGDAIFVAHNVRFDYSFISEEFRRLDRRFRHPQLCTCASMRKLYQGYKSYSLGNLCRAFNIALDSHHRALCDAEAAAELLLLVNARRLEASSAIECVEA